MKRQVCHAGRAFLGWSVLLRMPGSWIASAVRAFRKSRESLRMRLGLLLLVPAGALQVHAQTLYGPSYSEWRISPSSITVQQGTYTGSVSALATKDQTGTQNNPSKYVQFGTPSGQQFTGYLSFSAPSGITLSQITSIQLMANVLAPQDTADSWDYSIYNWKNAAYEHLGN